jgi:CDP-diacylglycerol---serine O-phosphatidyltransferase
MTGPKKLAFFLPNSFTALNLACGFVSVLLSFQGEFYYGCIILGLGAIFDSVDGRVARLTGTESSFGEQFDSLSDLISFGLAPAILIYNRFLLDSGRIGIIIAFFYMLCGALRLARFNANIEKVSSNFFQGLPIPSGALCMLGLVLFSLDFKIVTNYIYLVELFVVCISLLMISNIPFSSFKDSPFVRKHKKAVLFFIFVSFAAILVNEKMMIFALTTAYVFGSLLYYITHRKALGDIFQWNESDES